MPVTLTGLALSLEDLEDDIQQASTEALTSTATLALATLRQNTPVDTGRARDSWNVITIPGIATEGQLAFTNDAPYIIYLNEGSSQQAPARFIEQSLLQHFDIAVVTPGEIS